MLSTEAAKSKEAHHPPTPAPLACEHMTEPPALRCRAGRRYDEVAVFSEDGIVMPCFWGSGAPKCRSRRFPKNRGV
ncbi:MAG: hypothetical protein NTZ05_17530 [Chloroflexi bacterium]|nr:hypothetical protein [Chloroflexota bacterium]